MSNSLMNTGISGLNAAQNMLNVISNNISNAHTVGYNRSSKFCGKQMALNIIMDLLVMVYQYHQLIERIIVLW